MFFYFSSQVGLIDRSQITVVRPHLSREKYTAQKTVGGRYRRNGLWSGNGQYEIDYSSFLGRLLNISSLLFSNHNYAFTFGCFGIRRCGRPAFDLWYVHLFTRWAEGWERYFSFSRVVRGQCPPPHHQIDVNNETVLLHWCFVLHLFSVILPPPRPHVHIDDKRQFFLITHTSLFFHFGTLITNPVRSNGLGAAGLSLYCWGGGGRDAAVVFGGRHGLH